MKNTLVSGQKEDKDLEPKDLGSHHSKGNLESPGTTSPHLSVYSLPKCADG